MGRVDAGSPFVGYLDAQAGGTGQSAHSVMALVARCSISVKVSCGTALPRQLLVLYRVCQVRREGGPVKAADARLQVSFQRYPGIFLLSRSADCPDKFRDLLRGYEGRVRYPRRPPTGRIVPIKILPLPGSCQSHQGHSP